MNIFNFIDDKGNILFDQSIGWMDIMRGESCGYTQIYSDKKGTNYIDKKGNVLSPEWFPIGYDFKNGKAIIKIKWHQHVIDKDGNFIN